MNSRWQPSASMDALRARAAIMQRIRSFFAFRELMEVETPCLSRYTVTDPYLEAMQITQASVKDGKLTDTGSLYLQTSPEYAMKRMLAAGSGDIFQITKAFRLDEQGRLHNPEFTMLEWYRIGFSMQQLINEVGELLMLLLNLEQFEQFTYCSLFERYVNIDPLSISTSELLVLCANNGLADYALSIRDNIDYTNPQQADGVFKDSLLQVLFNQLIEPCIGVEYPTVVSHFPASQASLATLSEDGKTANRFEVYYKGVELANGFNELSDAQVQQQRFAQDNQKRAALGLLIKPIDTHLIAALESGLPPCSGVALGIDRLLMLAMHKSSIAEVMSFTHQNC